MSEAAPAPAPAAAPAPSPAPAASPAAAPAAAAAAAPAPAATLLADGTEQTADTTEGSGDEAAPVERSAPEKYEFKLPEGTQIDSEVLGKFEGLARELKMPQAEAAKVVEGLAPVIQARVAQQLKDQVARTSDEWSAAARTDKEFGGAKLAENLAVAEGALQAFGTPELTKLLKESRLGNNPEFIRFCFRAGKSLAQDTTVTGGRQSATPTEDDKLRAAYPTMFKN